MICRRSESLGIHDASTPHDTHCGLGIVFLKSNMSRNADNTILEEGRMETEDAVHAEHVADKRIKAETLR